MTGPEYIKIRKQYIEALAWVVLQNSEKHDADTLINKAVFQLAREVKEEITNVLTH